MRGEVLAMLTYFTLTLGALRVAVGQPVPQIGPSLKEVEATWTAFWTAVSLGDLKEARKYVHSQLHPFPGTRLTLEELQDMAYQMAFCRLDLTPFPLNLLGEEGMRQLPPGALENVREVFYWVRCTYGDETTQTLVGLRRDVDGVWRLSLF